MMRRGWRIATVLAAAWAGCVSSEPVKPSRTAPPAPVAQVDAIDLQTVPAALNWDDDPGPDGLDTRIYFYRRAEPLPVSVKGGLCFLLFEGRVSADDLPSAQPFHQWPYASWDLRAHLVRDVIGWHYSFRLAWESKVPGSSVITLAVRYDSPDGPSVYSSPVSISMNKK